MGAYEKLLLVVNPKKAYEREMWRQAYDAAKGYDAATSGRRNRAWQEFNESAETTDRYSRDTIRARARDLERNSDIANAVILAYRRNVVGKGITLQAATDDEKLNEQLETIWKEWCRARNCDVTGEQSFIELLRMAVERKKVDGGVLFVYRYSEGGVLPFKLQTLEVDELATDQTEPHERGNRVVGGVEYNAYRKPMGYWIRQYDLDGYQTQKAVYLPAKDVYFFKSKRRPSQIREISDMAATLTRIRDVNEFITAVSVKERIAACLSVFIKKAVPSGGFGGRNAVNQGGQVDYAGKKLTPGMIQEMGAGDEIQVVDPKSTAGDAAATLKFQQGLIAAGQGLSYEAVSRDMSNSTYSSARQNAIEDEDAYAEDVEKLLDFMTEVYENFVISCYLAGIVEMPGFWDKKKAYMAHKWVRKPKKWIDPLKEANANKIALQSGQKTFQSICAEQGQDWKSVVDETAAVLDYAREKGLQMGGVIFGKDGNPEKPVSEQE